MAQSMAASGSFPSTSSSSSSSSMRSSHLQQRGFTPAAPAHYVQIHVQNVIHASASLSSAQGSSASACCTAKSMQRQPARKQYSYTTKHGSSLSGSIRRQQQSVAMHATGASWRQVLEDQESSEEGDDYGTDSHTALQVRIKVHAAGHTGKLDLTGMRLPQLPKEVLDLHDLEELSLVGNCLTELPDGVTRLTKLKRLGLAGNSLVRLPGSMSGLVSLEGLWLHGNQLTTLPSDLGQLPALRILSLSGNSIEALPELSGLTSLTELTAAGNRLTSLPSSVSRCTALRNLALNGNRLTQLPAGLGALQALDELMLQGNELNELPEDIGMLKALRELSAADNALVRLPTSLAGCTSLSRVYLYGNQLQHIQGSTFANLPALSSLWVEGNPLTPGSVAQLLQVAATLPGLKSLGLDQQQAAAATTSALQVLRPNTLRIGLVLGTGHGYFKLQYASAGTSPLSTSSASSNTGNGSWTHGSASASATAPHLYPPSGLLVVAFGSAPGTPNWGGLLTKVYKAAGGQSPAGDFDVLYVADPSRSWYGGGDDSALDVWTQRMVQYTSRYNRVLMLGDSMGATAALLFCQQATAVLAFCPQVGLESSAIRPGHSPAWLRALTSRVLAAVGSCDASITTCTGTWEHDVEQVRLLPSSRINSRVFSVDSHRLAAALDKQGKLMPLVQDAIASQKGIRSGNVRLANIL